MTEALLLGVTGTGTEVGKSLVAAGLVRALAAGGLRVDALKLVATGTAPGQAGEDAELLGAAAGREPRDCVLETYALPRSPRAAAAHEGRTLDVAGLIDSVRSRRGEGAGILVLEGVGGLLVPLDERCTVADVFRELGARTVIVGAAGLGTINHCALSVAVAVDRGLDVAGIILSDAEGVDPAFAAENAAEIEAQCGVRVLGIVPRCDTPRDVEALGALVGAHVDLAPLRVPSASSRDRILGADHAHVWHPFTQQTEWLAEDPPVVERGSGCWLVDVDGRRLLDGIASLWANVHGHAHPRLDGAVRAQLGRIAHSTFLGQTHEPGALLAEELIAVAPAGLSRVFYSEAGAAAVEVALRIALLAQQRRGDAGRTRFLSLDDAYHGDTAGAVSVGRSEPFHRGLDPMLFDVVRTATPHAVGAARATELLRQNLAAHGATLAALIIEPRMQGAAGMLPHDDEWLRSSVRAAREAGLLVICDEVATGFGRTGDLFASTGAGVEPDLMVLGKGLTGGYLPLSATLATGELFDLFSGSYMEHRTLYYGHTFSGSPLACAVARASLALFDEESTLERARRLGDDLGRGLAEVAALAGVHEVRRRGVMAGIELRRPDGTAWDPARRVGRQVALAARRRGVIVRPLGDVVVLNPPLVMSTDEAALLTGAVAESIAEVTASAG